MIPGLMTFLLYLTTKTAWYVRQHTELSLIHIFHTIHFLSFVFGHPRGSELTADVFFVHMISFFIILSKSTSISNIPVSYTHLEATKKFIAYEKMKKDVVEAIPEQIKDAYPKARPVSYTHLDVYKRQG